MAGSVVWDMAWWWYLVDVVGVILLLTCAYLLDKLRERLRPSAKRWRSPRDKRKERDCG